MSASDKANKVRVKTLKELAKKSSNKKCFNCLRGGPQNNVCIDFSTFVCMQCAGIHRSMQHTIKSINMATFKDSDVEAFQEGGNKKARKEWLYSLTEEEHEKIERDNNEMVKAFMTKVYVDKKYHSSKGGEKAKSSKKKKKKDKEKKDNSDSDDDEPSASVASPTSKKAAPAEDTAKQATPQTQKSVDLLGDISSLDFDSPAPAPANNGDESKASGGGGFDASFDAGFDEPKKAPKSNGGGFDASFDAGFDEPTAKQSDPAGFDAGFDDADFGSSPAPSKPAQKSTDPLDFFDDNPAPVASGGGGGFAFDEPSSSPASGSGDPKSALVASFQSVMQSFGLSPEQLYEHAQAALQAVGARPSGGVSSGAPPGGSAFPSNGGSAAGGFFDQPVSSPGSGDPFAGGAGSNAPAPSSNPFGDYDDGAAQGGYGAEAYPAGDQYGAYPPPHQYDGYGSAEQQQQYGDYGGGYGQAQNNYGAQQAYGMPPHGQQGYDAAPPGGYGGPHQAGYGGYEQQGYDQGAYGHQDAYGVSPQGYAPQGGMPGGPSQQTPAASPTGPPADEVDDMFSFANPLK